MSENVEHDAEMIEEQPEVEAEVEEQEPMDPLEAAEHALAEEKDKSLRLVAELRNVQQRAQREKEAAL